MYENKRKGYLQSGRRRRDIQPCTPWSAGFWSDISSAASPSLSFPLRTLGTGEFSEPGRFHRVDLTRSTAPSAWLSRVCSFMLEVEATSHALWNCWRDYECVWTQDILITACVMKNSLCTKSSIVAQWRVGTGSDCSRLIGKEIQDLNSVMLHALLFFFNMDH